MPAEYTHQIIAENVLEALPAAQRERVSDFSAYCIGAQGGDVFYFLRIFIKIIETIKHILYFFFVSHFISPYLK